jgi:hypothetical protein
VAPHQDGGVHLQVVLDPVVDRRKADEFGLAGEVLELGKGDGLAALGGPPL